MVYKKCYYNYRCSVNVKLSSEECTFMRKKFLLIFLILSLSVLAACGRSTDGPGKTAPTETAAPTGTPAPTETAAPTGTPTPTETAAPTGTPAPTEAATPTGTPAPTGITEPPEAVREEIKIAVIDTGISSSVIDSGRILEGKNYIEPQHDTEDRIGHGTALAAFIVGSVPARMEGYCPDALLVPLVYADMTVRRTDDAQTTDGSDTDDAAQTADSSGTDDAAQTADSSGTDDAVQTMGGPELIAQAVRDAVDCYGCRVILISSGTQKDEPALHEAVKYAKDNNVLVVSCAGNSYYTDTDAIYYPGSYDEALCVGSLNGDGEPAYFSQRNEFVDVWEIGTDLRLATLKGTRIRGEGTSYSAAIVAAKAADLLAKDSGLTVDDLMRMLAEK